MNGETLDHYSQLAIQKLTYAASHKPKEDDPIYRVVTQGRDTGNAYSSCADLAHWLLWELGCRQWWLNREEPPTHKWRVGLNVALLLPGWKRAGQSPARSVRAGITFEPGDILHIASGSFDSHIMCVIDHNSKTQRCVVAEYGQPGGHIATKTFNVVGDRLFSGWRQVRHVLRLEAVLIQAEERRELQC